MFVDSSLLWNRLALLLWILEMGMYIITPIGTLFLWMVLLICSYLPFRRLLERLSPWGRLLLLLLIFILSILLLLIALYAIYLCYTLFFIHY